MSGVYAPRLATPSRAEPSNYIPANCGPLATLDQNFRSVDWRAPVLPFLQILLRSDFRAILTGEQAVLGTGRLKREGKPGLSWPGFFFAEPKEKPRTGEAGANLIIRLGEPGRGDEGHHPQPVLRRANCHFPVGATTFLFGAFPLKPKWLTPRLPSRKSPDGPKPTASVSHYPKASLN